MQRAPGVSNHILIQVLGSSPPSHLFLLRARVTSSPVYLGALRRNRHSLSMGALG